MARFTVTLRPFNTAAAARMSSMRPLVHEPMNTVSTGTSRMFMPAVSPMYSNARSMVLAVVASGASAGDGMTPSMGRTCAGLVPQLTYGVSVDASMNTSASHFAPSSVFSSFHAATAASQSAPFGACSRPFKYSKVVSSGAIRPAFAPASMLMLHTVMRPSIERARIAEPRYSMT